MWTTPFGHGYMGDYHSDDRLVTGMGNPVFEEYRKQLINELGEAKADRILRVTPLEHHRLPELLVHEPVPAAAHRASGRGRSLGGAHLLVAHEARAGAHVPRHDRLRQRGQRYRFLGTHRRPRGLRACAARPASGATDWVYVGRGHGGDVQEPGGTRPRGERHERRCSSAPRCAPGSTTWARPSAAKSSSFSTMRRGCWIGELEAWLELFTEDATYWVPLERGQRTRSRPHRSSTTTARSSSCA